MTATEYTTYEARLAIAECEYELAKLNADWLGISIDEYYDFVADMDGEVTYDITPEELEAMYVDYGREYEIPCLKIPNDYACYDREGW